MKKKIICMAFVIAALSLSACDGADGDLMALEGYAEKLEEVADSVEAEAEALEDFADKNDADSEEPEENAEDTGDITDAKDSGEPDLKAMILEEAVADEDELLFFDAQDFDGDGTKEAFAITGESLDDFEELDIAEGAVWFAGSDGCVKLIDSDGMGTSISDRIMTLGDTKYVLFDNVYATGIQTFAWSVSDGNAVEAAFSGAGEILPDEDGEDVFEIMDSSYDSIYDPEIDGLLGHTWKHYYFFYNKEDDSVYEYGGTEIDKDKAEELCGMDIVGEFLPEDDRLDSLFLRGNGLVVMNYEHEENEEIYYFHIIYDFVGGTFIDDTGEETGEEPLEGTYKEALCPDMAYYPEVPGF
ncbi:MAG: hypothetical protein K5770_04110 [Lachnospiraceae bacterium]|nr:hypothetical protein [Lachnospiraceae bacterium]